MYAIVTILCWLCCVHEIDIFRKEFMAYNSGYAVYATVCVCVCVSYFFFLSFFVRWKFVSMPRFEAQNFYMFKKKRSQQVLLSLSS